MHSKSASRPVRRSYGGSLREHADQLALAQEAIGLATWIWDLRMDRVQWFGDMGALLGLPPRKFAGRFQDYLGALHLDDRAAASITFVECLKGLRPQYRSEERVIWPDGSTHWLETYGRGSYGADGRCLRMVGVVRDITDRKEQQSALAASEARFEKAFRLAPTPLAITRAADGAFVEVNKGFERASGWSAGEVIGRTSMELGFWINPKERDDHVATMARDGSVREMRVHLRHKNGGTRICDMTSDKIDIDGETFVVTQTRDFTEILRAQEERRSAEGKYHAMFDSSSEAMSIARARGGIFIEVNAAWLELTGRTRAEVIGRSSLEIPLWADPGEQEAIISRLMAEGHLSNISMRIPRPDGRIVEALGSFSLFQLDGEQCIAWLGHDVTELRHSEEARRKAETIYRAIFENAVEGIFLVNAEGRVVSANPMLAQMLGYESAEKMGEAIVSVEKEIYVEPGARARFREEVIAQSTIEDFETRWRRKDGSTFWVSMTGRLIEKETGGALHHLGMARDISERKAQQEKIKRLSRVYAVLSGINAAIVRVRERDELYREACRIAVAAGGFIVARVIELDSKGKVRLAATTESESRLFLKIIEEYNRDPEHAASFVALALRSGLPTISNDVANDPRIPDRRALTKNGNYALALFPIIVEKRIKGAMVLRALEPGMFDEDEVRLLGDMIANLSFALELIDKQRQLDYLAYYDVLTGLANQGLFHHRLSQYVHIAQQNHGELALALMNVERFKTINDSLGRSVGDALLKQIAERLERAADATNIARLGGDQFALVVPEIKGRSEIARNVDRIWRECFTQPFQVNDDELHVSAKVGIALFPNDGGDAETLIACAEAALRIAQQTGERHQFHSREMTAKVTEQFALESKLRHALQKNEYVLHYQPKVDLETRRIVGAEALIRWQSPELGLVPPMKFIPLMEETGLILEVGAWALTKAVEDHMRWLSQGLPAPRLAVNVSPVQLRRRDFYATLENAIRHGPACPGIDLEITESLIMENIQGNIESLRAVRNLGVSIAIDDFGTGYSSLGYLAKLPVNAVKIDRSFIITMLNDPDTMLLVRTIISLAHSLRLKVVAEGVDSADQAKVLRHLACDEMQGYLYSRPIPFEEMTVLLKQT